MVCVILNFKQYDNNPFKVNIYFRCGSHRNNREGGGENLSVISDLCLLVLVCLELGKQDLELDSTGCSLNIVFFPSNVVIFLNSASSAAALLFYLPGVCTHTDTEGKQSSEYF